MEKFMKRICWLSSQMKFMLFLKVRSNSVIADILISGYDDDR